MSCKILTCEDRAFLTDHTTIMRYRCQKLISTTCMVDLTLSQTSPGFYVSAVHAF